MIKDVLSHYQKIADDAWLAVNRSAPRAIRESIPLQVAIAEFISVGNRVQQLVEAHEMADRGC